MSDVIPAAGERMTVGELVGILSTLDPALPIMASVSMGSDTYHAEAGWLDVVLPDEQRDADPEGERSVRCVVLGATSEYAS